MDNEVFNSIINEYEKLRSDEKRERDMRVKKVYSEVPEIEEIDKRIARIGGETLRTILSDPENTGVKDEMKNKFDYKSVGGAFMAGFTKPVVKAHGASDDVAFLNAMKLARSMVKEESIEKMKAGLMHEAD